MAETFQTVNVALGNSVQTQSFIHVQAATTAIVIHCQVANVDGTNAADLNIDMNDGSVVAALVSYSSSPCRYSAVNPIGGKTCIRSSR